MIRVFSTAEGLLTQDDRVTADGLQEVFATNVFGHFVLVKCQQANTRCWDPKGCPGTPQHCFVKLSSVLLVFDL